MPATPALNLVIPVVQTMGGLPADSVALISDALHNFSDAAALLCEWACNGVHVPGPKIGGNESPLG